MRAAVCERYGPPEVLRVVDVPVPTPEAREVRIAVVASAVTSSDTFIRGLRLPPAYRALARLRMGLTGPRVRVLGLVLAGEVDAVGAGVTRFRKGEAVYGFTFLRFGCNAEYACVPEDAVLAPLPAGASFVEAAAIPYGGLLGLHTVRRARVRSGQRVMVYGASGAVGTSMVQLAAHLGAHVTGVCGPSNLDLVRSLGASEVIDYTVGDVPDQVETPFDVVVDAVGRTTRKRCAGALAPGGRFFSVNQGTPRFTVDQLTELTALNEIGALRPVVDRVFPLEQIVDAHRYVETGHKRGNVVVTMGDEAHPG